MKRVDELLESEIEALLDRLSYTEPDSDEFERIADELVELMKLRNQKVEKDDELNIRKLELKQRIAELESKKKFDFKQLLITTGVGILGIVAPMIFNGIWYKKGLQFEETGTYTSTTYREIRNKKK